MFNDDNYNLNNLNSQEDYYFSNDNNSFSDSKINFKDRKKFDPKWVIIGLLIIAIIVIIVLIFSDNGGNDTVAVITYNEREREMQFQAESYIAANNFTYENDYLLISTFGYIVPENCSGYSGVLIIDGEVYANLICNDYHSSGFFNNDLELVGDEIYIIGSDTKYRELGTVEESKTSSYVGSNPGLYIISYDSNGKGANRAIVRLKDNNLPKIELKGEEEIRLKNTEKYSEAGYTSGNNVTVNDNINSKKDGTYHVDYFATDSYGLDIYNSRIVYVYGNNNNSINYDIKFSEEDESISLKIIGNFKEVILPSGVSSTLDDIVFPVSTNGTYEFKIISHYNEDVIASVTVNSFDSEPPKVTCTAYIYPTETTVSVSAADNSGISKYLYEYGEYSKESTSSSLKYALTNIKDISVTAFDNHNNKTKVDCEVIDKRDDPGVDIDPSKLSPRCTMSRIYQGKKYPLEESQIKKLAAMVTAEYGSDATGAYAVASHMANLYEYKTWAKSKDCVGKTFYQYITSTKWYASGTRKRTNYKDFAYQAVVDTLVNGKRTLPHYVDDFDWYKPGQKCDIRNPKDPEEYKPMVSEIKNVYGSTGIFFCVTVNERETDGNLFFYHANYKAYYDSLTNKN